MVVTASGGSLLVSSVLRPRALLSYNKRDGPPQPRMVLPQRQGCHRGSPDHSRGKEGKGQDRPEEGPITPWGCVWRSQPGVLSRPVAGEVEEQAPLDDNPSMLISAWVSGHCRPRTLLATPLLFWQTLPSLALAPLQPPLPVTCPCPLCPQ